MCRWRSTCCPTFCQSTFDPANCAAANVIVQEIGATEDAPDDLVFDRLQETAFPKQAVGRSILGTPETVRSFNPDGIRAYLSRNYRGPDMLVAAAGAVEHKAIVEAAEKKFASFTGPEGPKPEQAHFGGGTRVETRDLEQVHIALALKGLPVVDPQLYSVCVSPACSVAACRRACSRKCARSAASATRSTPSYAYWTSVCSGLYAGPTTDAPNPCG